VITNSRLIELRATGLACLDHIAAANPSDRKYLDLTVERLEQDYADLFQFVVDGQAQVDETVEYRTRTHLAFLLGK
jgi:hypothetical protein